MNMSDPKISLMIYGTRLEERGWEPLLVVNDPPFRKLSDDIFLHRSIAGNPMYYSVRIEPEYTQYTLTYRPPYVRPYGGSGRGSLKVSISIPKGCSPAGSSSPYDILEVLQHEIERHVLTPTEGGASRFEFKPEFPSRDVFTKVLDSFPLVRKQMEHHPMSPAAGGKVGVLVLDGQRADDFFQDVQYPEFADYGEIVVARSGTSDPVLENLVIPRRKGKVAATGGQPQPRQANATAGQTGVRADRDSDRKAPEPTLRDIPNPRPKKQSGDVIAFRLILESPGSIADSKLSCPVRFSKDDTEFTLMRRFRKDSGRGCWYTDITVPVEWRGTYFVELETDKVKVPADKVSFDLQPSTAEAVIGPGDTIGLSWRVKYGDRLRALAPRIWKGAAIIFAFIIAFFASMSIYDKFRIKSQTEQETEYADNHYDDNDENIDVSNSIYKQMQQYLLDLKIQGISFRDIHTMATWAEEHSHDLESVEGGPEFKEKIDAYERLVEAIQYPATRDVLDIRRIVKESKGQIEPTHLELLDRLTGKGRKFSHKETDLINQRLRNDSQYSSFLELPSADDIIAEDRIKPKPKPEPKPMSRQKDKHPTGEDRTGEERY